MLSEQKAFLKVWELILNVYGLTDLLLRQLKKLKNRLITHLNILLV